MLELTVAPDAAVFFAGSTGKAESDYVKVVVKNNANVDLAIRAHSKTGTTELSFDNTSNTTVLPARGQAGLTIRLLEDVRVQVGSRAVDEVFLYGEIGTLASPIPVSLAQAPCISITHPYYDGEGHGRKDTNLGVGQNRIEIAVPKGEQIATMGRAGENIVALVRPVGPVPLYLAQHPGVDCKRSSTNAPDIAVQVSESLAVTETNPLKLVLEAATQASLTADSSVSIEFDFVGLGQRNLDFSFRVLREPEVRIEPLQAYVDLSGALPRYYSESRTLGYRVVNDSAEPILLVGVDAHQLEAQADFVSAHNGPPPFQMLDPGEDIGFSFEIVPLKLPTGTLPKRRGANAVLERLDFDLRIRTKWKREDAACYETVIQQSIDFRLPKEVDVLGLDFGTSNTCIGYVDSIERLYGAMPHGVQSPREIFCQVGKHIELVNLDQAKSEDVELPSAVRVNSHPRRHDIAPQDVVVGQNAFKDMLFADYAQRTAWMMKRGLLADGFGRTIIDSKENARLYRWSLLVESYLRQAFTSLLNKHSVWPRRVVFSFPGTWERRPEIRELLHRTIAAATAGFSLNTEISPGLSEPESLALYYANQLAIGDNIQKNVQILDMAIFDCGGGTTDIAVLRLHAETYNTPEGSVTVWVTHPHERRVRAKDRGGEDLTLEFAKIVHEALRRKLESKTSIEDDGVTPKSSTEGNTGTSRGRLIGKLLKKKHAQEAAADGSGAKKDRTLVALPNRIIDIASGNNLDADEREVLTNIILAARELKRQHYSQNKRRLKRGVEVRWGGVGQNVQIELENERLSDAAVAFAKELILDLLAPTISGFHREYGLPDQCALVLCGNSTRHPAFPGAAWEYINEQLSKERRPHTGDTPKRNKTFWLLQTPDEQRKVNLVKGLILNALHEMEELGEGRPNPLADVLENLPIRTASAHGDTEKSTGHAIRLVVMGQVEEGWCHLGATSFRLESLPTRARNVDVEVSIADSESGPWTRVFRDRSVGDSSELKAQWRDVGLRTLRFVLSAKESRLALEWIGERFTSEIPPRGRLAVFHIDSDGGIAEEGNAP